MNTPNNEKYHVNNCEASSIDSPNQKHMDIAAAIDHLAVISDRLIELREKIEGIQPNPSLAQKDMPEVIHSLASVLDNSANNIQDEIQKQSNLIQAIEVLLF